MAIRAVIFDYGMVLSNPAVPSAHARLVVASGLSREILDQHYWANRHSYDLGMTGREFWAKVASDAGTTFSPAQVVNLIESDVLMWTSVNEEMLAWVEALQGAGIRTAVLSNMVWEILLHMQKRFGWLDRFDQLTWSCELGIAKPDPEIYLYTCEALEVPPEETLFLDDKPENIAGAEVLGLRALLFTTAEQLRKDLETQGLSESLPVPGFPIEARP
ncbi:MAG: HAD family phosphatase [Acidobacteriaceae bacterium]